ncbi:hypothetical protein [Peribacillus glennii]|uniref:Uncharacterized protein n=1 Tax=Peribacillus glennii TaxID=2303991 RepID=A0A372L7H9_9BACI|nr:hypothetical protein [Peribacillus glennii]RFU61223.1 hypothetical protein D0466_18580 [Peribacillus glennii]
MNLNEYFEVKEKYADIKLRLIKIAAKLHENDQYSNDEAVNDLMNIIGKIEGFDVKISDAVIEDQ